MSREKAKAESLRLRSRIGLRAHLICVMLLLLALFLLITWVFQSAFMELMYESVRRRELERTADKISAELGGERLQPTVYDLSMDGLMSILIYRIDGDRGVRIASQHATEEIEKNFTVTAEQISKFYGKALSSEEGYHTQVVFGGQEIGRSFFQSILPIRRSGEVAPETVNMVYARVCEDAGGVPYLILLNAPMTPLTSTVAIFRHQFWYIFVILLIVTLLISIPLSKRLTKPITHMSGAAKQLARGNYKADFASEFGSYRETVELAEALNHAAEELAKNDQLQKELIANISHDLRTPLTMIRGYAEVMRDIPDENTPENVQVLIDETEHLSELVSDLLDLSKIQSGVRCPVMEFFDLNDALREVMGRYGAFTKAQGYTITLNAEGEAFVFADRGMILQVVYNLINNAINYTGEDLSVAVTQTVEDGRVRITVTDTGEGIPEDQLPLIWDRYYKVDKTHRSARIGTGLGLSIARGVLEVHHAAYGVKSEVGKGSSFWFELPISEPPVNEEKD